MLPKLRPGQLEEQVYHALKEAILSGGFRSGDPLVESKIADALGTSNTPVRSALTRLANEGLVTSEAYRGHRVATLSTEDVRHICEIRKLLQGHLVSRLAEDQPSEVVHDLLDRIERGQRAFEHGDQAESLKYVREFETIIIESAANPYISDVLRNLLERLFLIGITSTIDSSRLEQSLKEHRAITDAIVAGRTGPARVALERHVDSIYEAYRMTHDRMVES